MIQSYFGPERCTDVVDIYNNLYQIILITQENFGKMQHIKAPADRKIALEEIRDQNIIHLEYALNATKINNIQNRKEFKSALNDFRNAKTAYEIEANLNVISDQFVALLADDLQTCINHPELYNE